ncbi:MAG TPA: SPOR domain-containing protein [Thiothrix sp.]|nr:SPOR domain-containing protein [Thiothrix sp.]
MIWSDPLKTYKQNGFVNLTTLIFLGIVAAGIGFMYYKGYRVDVTTRSGAGAGSAENPDGFYYTVQVSVTPNEANAIGLVNDLEDDGYDAYYDTYESEMGRQYKIRVGQYADKQSAAAVRSQVRERYQSLKDSFVKLINKD